MTDAANDKPEAFDLNSDDVAARKRADLRRLFPEVFDEDKIDFEQLRRVMGDWVDEGAERYGLSWAGKSACIKVVQEPATGALRPDESESISFDDAENIFIEGDNLEVLKLLQSAYFESIKLIYIDPPYNTGKDFIYPDNYQENLQTYLRYSGQIDDDGKLFATNSETSGRFHSRWLNMMKPRLYLAKNLLKDDGAIFISIDHHELINLIALCDQIFGEENQVGIISVINNMKGRNDRDNIATANEFVVIYSKGNFSSCGIPLNNEQIKQYKFEDENGNSYARRDLRKRGGADTREDRPNLYFPLYYDDDENEFSLTDNGGVPIYPLKSDGTEGCWRWGKTKIGQNLSIMHARSKGGEFTGIDYRVYLDPTISGVPEADDDDEIDDEEHVFDRTSKSKSFWWGAEFSTDTAGKEFKTLFDGVGTDYPKSVALMKRVVQMATHDGDIVLDFFAGNATTAHAIVELNASETIQRKFIMVQLPEKISKEHQMGKAGYSTISQVGRTRVRKIIDKIGASDGFRAFSLAPSAFSTWHAKSDSEARDLLSQLEEHASNVKNASDKDILFELLLKDGFKLTTKVDEVDIKNGKVYSVADGALLICLERNLSKEIIDALADLAEDKETARVVCLDAGFQGNDQLKTNAVQTFKSRLGHGEDSSMFRTV